MRSRAVFISIAVVVVLLAGAGAVYAYDHARADTIAKGVQVGGVDVGGLTSEQAAAKLRSTVLDPLKRPLVVRAAGKRYRLTPEQAAVGVDIDGSVRAALQSSREGNLLSRAWREFRGKQLNHQIALDISYSKPAIAQLVHRVAEKTDRPAVDASVDLESGDVTPQQSHEGRRVQTGRLERALRKRLLDVSAPRKLDARVVPVDPKVSTDDLAKEYPAILFVDRSSFTLTLYKNLKREKTYGIAVGQVGLETPAGLYHIQNKAVDPAWTMPNSSWVAPADRGKIIPGGTPENPLKARWLGIFDGAGIHGTDAVSSIGSAASHGCVRMLIPDVIELYDQVPVGAPVYIA
jgi:lipoprotein-anchoring transpeptidase ErfK/SrfK